MRTFKTQISPFICTVLGPLLLVCRIYGYRRAFKNLISLQAYTSWYGYLLFPYGKKAIFSWCDMYAFWHLYTDIHFTDIENFWNGTWPTQRLACKVKIYADDSLKCFFLIFSQTIGFGISCKMSPKETLCMKYQNLFLKNTHTHTHT